ncbi:MAG: YtxH domain-containing protein [Peptoniphilus harei]|nr:YtxH domain-containing protein [Peptoniphilus harei]MDU1663102.1 YtxH domain-containing protein [Peptoniphilus harei]
MKFRKIFTLTLLLLLMPAFVFAEDFKEINIDVNIDKNGIGEVKEVWQINEDNRDYTERYKLINNLQGIKIEGFSVNSLGKDFTELSPWNIDASFEDKAYHYGRIDREDEVELTWGISEFSDNTYNLSYKINPVIVGLNDSDMLFFKFVGENFDPKPKRVQIKIRGFEPFKDVKMWGFGMEGEIHNVNGEILMTSSDYVDYATVMLKFPKGYFNTAYKIDKDFNDYATLAAEGSHWENREGQAYQKPMSTLEKSALSGIFLAVLAVIYFVARLITLGFSKKRIENKKELATIKDLKGEYYKDLPYRGPLEDLAFFISQAYLVDSNLVGNYINSFILKWSLNGNIEFIEEGSGFSKNKIKIISEPKNMGPLEEELFQMISSANNENNAEYMTAKDFKKYVKANKDDMENYYDEFEDKSIEALKAGGYLENYSYEKKFLFAKKTGTELRVTEKGKELWENLIKFKNYLKDYGDQVTDEVEFEKWQDFLIYSSIFFLDEEFVRGASAYPAYINNYALYNTHIITSKNFSKDINSSYQAATGFNSAGFGGTTSVGGGGGSFGGGGGGGR